MGKNYTAEKRVEHKAVALGPDLIIPPKCTYPVPCVTIASFDEAVAVAKNTRGNVYEFFTDSSYVPHCKGGVPHGKGIISGTWNGAFVPDKIG